MDVYGASWSYREIESVHTSMHLLRQEALSIIPPMTGHTPLLLFGQQQPRKCRQCVGWRCTVWLRNRQLDREDLCQEPCHNTSSVMTRRCQVMVLRLSHECCLLGSADDPFGAEQEMLYCWKMESVCLVMMAISARDDVTPLLISQGCLLGVVLL